MMSAQPAPVATPAEECVVAVFNAVGSSLRYELLTGDGETVAQGGVERIGQPECCPDHLTATARAIADLDGRVPGWRDGVAVVGHRVVHGGPDLREPTVVDARVLAELDRRPGLAPLHTPAALRTVRAARALLPWIPHVAVFDPGFHGLSCEYLVERLGALEPAARRVVLCHLGAGASVTAVEDGRSIDTGPGFILPEGLAMATRRGGLDPSAVPSPLTVVGPGPGEVATSLEREAGLGGPIGDFRAVEAAADAGDPTAARALEGYAHRVRKYVGAHWAELGGLDALVFAGGIGENGAGLRAAVVEPLAALGVRLDPAANRSGPSERRISLPGSPVAVWVIPTRESRVIARHARSFARPLSAPRAGASEG